MKIKHFVITFAVIGFVGIGSTALLTNQRSLAEDIAQNETAPEGKTEQWPVVTVYKNASCGCCQRWIEHMEKNGFQVEAHDVNNLQVYKEQAKLGAGMGSCHTAFVGDYAIEGHVPAADVKRLLEEKPDVSGLTVPKMPIGSPGMEVPGRAADSYQVISYKAGKEVGVFQQY